MKEEKRAKKRNDQRKRKNPMWNIIKDTLKELECTRVKKDKVGIIKKS